MIAGAGLTLATAASAATIGAPGSASAAVPNANNQMCGNAVAAGNAAVQGVSITASLYDSSGAVVFGPQSTDTDAAGAWCITGNSTLANTVLNGGHVELCATPMAVDGKSANFLGSGTNCADLDKDAFQDHLYTSVIPLILASADGLDVTYS
ncbi:hypothetical protein GCM10023353_35490 [Tomitella cavernea]|uniref:Uncharacterized protein n=2 Tax=Tomitella cavernea TaxID=1387982 RepID=A0ABP9D0C8_9ACTN